MKAGNLTVKEFDLHAREVHDRLAHKQLAANLKGKHEVRSTEVTPMGMLKVVISVGALKGNDKTKALEKLTEQIEQIIAHKAKMLKKKSLLAASLPG